MISFPQAISLLDPILKVIRGLSHSQASFWRPWDAAMATGEIGSHLPR